MITGLRWACCLGALCAAVGCATGDDGEPAPGRAALEALALARGPALWAPPDDGADGAPEFEVRWSPGGPVFPARAIASLPWGDAAVVLDASRLLHRFERDGRVVPLAEHASTPLASPDGKWLGYATGPDYGPKDVHVVDRNGQDRVVAQGVLAPALLAFGLDGRELTLLAAGPGGVMGRHAIDLAAAAPSLRCVTNCQLRTGEDWGDRFVELPAPVGP